LAWTASFWILSIPGFWYAGRPIGLGVKPVLAATWKYTVGSLLAGCLCAEIMPSLSFVEVLPGAAGALVRIVTVALLFGILYLGTVILLHRGFAPLLQVAGLLKEMLSIGKTVSPAPPVAATAGMPWTPHPQ